MGTEWSQYVLPVHGAGHREDRHREQEGRQMTNSVTCRPVPGAPARSSVQVIVARRVLWRGRHPQAKFHQGGRGFGNPSHWFTTVWQSCRGAFYRHCAGRSVVHHTSAVARSRRSRDLRAKRTHEVAHPPSRSDADYRGWLRQGTKLGRFCPRSSPRRRHMVSAGREALARSNVNDGHDPYRSSRARRW